MSRRTRLAVVVGMAALLLGMVWTAVRVYPHRRAERPVNVWLAENELSAAVWLADAAQEYDHPADLLHSLEQTPPEAIVTAGSSTAALLRESGWLPARYRRAHTAGGYTIWTRRIGTTAERWTPQAINVNRMARVVGGIYTPLTLSAGRPITVGLRWHSTRPVTDSFMTVIQLIAPGAAQPIANWEQPTPADRPIDWWAAEQTMTQWIVLTPTVDAPFGAYRLTFAARPLDVPDRRPLYAGGDANALDQAAVGWVTLPWTGTIPAEAHRPQPPIGIGPAADPLGELAAYTVPDEWVPGRPLSVTLYWRGARPWPDAYTVFVHLVDGGGNLIANGDGPPVNGRYATPGWRAGELVPDTHLVPVPADLPPGDYRLQVGFYQPETGTRPAVRLGDEVRADGVIPLADFSNR